MNIYSISSDSLDIYPMKLTNLDKRDLKVGEYDFTQGISLRLYSLLNNPIDFNYSNYSGLVLTDNKNYKDIINYDNTIDAEDYVKSSTISMKVGNDTEVVLSGGLFKIYVLDKSSKIIAIKNSVGDYLTKNFDDSLSFAEYNSGYLNQKFFYTRSNNKVLLYEFINGITLKRVLALNKNGFEFVALSSNLYARTDKDFTLDYYFNNFKDYDINYSENEKLVYYNPSISSNGENLTINSSNEVSKPYLVSFSYFDNKEHQYEINSLALKNTKSSDYYYTPNLNRKYSSISNRSSCLNGDSEIILGYDSYDYGTIILNSGDNYFYHYPKGGKLSIHNSGLLESGSIPSMHPEFSDRIYKDQRQNSYGLSSSLYINEKNGTYLYTWLSGGIDESVWTDRFRINSLSGNSNSLFNDKKSKLDFEPSIGYYYHRIERTDVNNYITLLDNSLIKKVELYNLNNVEKYSEELNRETDLISNDDILVLTGRNFATIEKDYTLSGDFTFAFKVYQKDWNDSKGTMIIGDYFNDSGWGLFFSDQITPYITFTYNDKINHYNSGLLNTQTVLYEGSGTLIKVVRTTDDCYWLVSEKDSYLYDLSGNIIDYVLLSGLGTVNDFKVNSIGDFYVKYTTGIIYKFNRITKEYSVIVSNIFGAMCINTLDVLNYDALSSTSKMGNDGNNILYRIDSGRLVFDSINLLSSTTIKDFAFDGNNRMWVIDDDYVVILDENRIEIDRIISIANLSDTNLTRTISILKTSDDYIGILRTVSSNKSYIETFKFENDTLSLIKGIRDSTQQAISYEDFTGFDYINRYSSKNKLILKINFLNKNDLNGNNNLKIRKNLNLDIDSGYHLFSLTYNLLLGEIKFSIDGVLIYQKNIAPNTYVLADLYGTPLLIGTYPNKVEAIGKTNLENYNTSMKIKDVRIYSTTLNYIEQNLLLMRDYNIPSISWVIPSEKRIMIEKIERIFKNRIPGNKSTIFNLNINNSSLDDDTKLVAEDSIKSKLENWIPVNSALNRIIWK